MRKKLEGYDFYRETLGSPVKVVAPMVDMSELAWRELSRSYGADLCYTPMFHSSHFASSATYRAENFTTNPADRPLIVQFCSNSPETLLKAAKLVEDRCDAVDINLGCPQGIARRGHYGAFLQDEWELIASMVALLHRELAVPVTCKIRVFKDVKRTVEYARMMERAGCQLLTVHGRTREMKGPHTGLADWDQIRAVREAIKIPMFANGNILYHEDIERCIKHTGVDGVMTAETNLFNPALFAGVHPPTWEVVDRYLEIALKHKTGFIYVKGHVFKIYNLSFQIRTDLRDLLSAVRSVEDIVAAQAQIKAGLQADSAVDHPVLRVQEVTTCENFRQLPYWICQPYFRSTRLEALSAEERSRETELQRQRAAERKERKEAKRARKADAAVRGATPAKRKKYPNCGTCNKNPASAKCTHQMCKPCCLVRTVAEMGRCEQHGVYTGNERWVRRHLGGGKTQGGGVVEEQSSGTVVED